MQSARHLPRKVLKTALQHIKMKDALYKFIVFIINWSLIGSHFAPAPYCSFSVLPQVQNLLHYHNFFPGKWQIKSILSIRLYLNSDKLPRTTNYSLLFRSQSLCRTLLVYRSKELAAYGIGRILLTNVSNVIRDAIRKSIRSRQILLHIEQAMFSYNAVRSLKKLKYS